MKKFLFLTLVGSSLVGLSACNSSPSAPIAAPSEPIAQNNTQSDRADKQASPSPSPSASLNPTTATPVPNSESTGSTATSSPEPVKISTATTTTKEITVYKLDDQCNGYVAEKLPMPAQGTPDAIVAKVLENSNTPDFNVANYRVNVKDGVATVDFRLPANAKRPFAALSTCEQMGLLGSLEKTLKENTSLNIQAVRFTDGKQELQF